VTLVVNKGEKCSKTTVRSVNQSHNSALVDINVFGSKFGRLGPLELVKGGFHGATATATAAATTRGNTQ
jgi:hypothetical protein